mmetsp:Transcript_3849/g.9359  ORF Transcript_3849/g.9359 Transcript_3849/m.9359 type:complete len:251 (+) Transcript_3849:136-888(+)
MPRLRLILLVCDLVASAEPEAAEQSGGFLEEIRSDGSMEAVSSIGAEGVFAAQDWEASEDSDSAESEDSAAPPYPDRTALPHYDFENDFAPASLLATGETHQQSGCLDGLCGGAPLPAVPPAPSPSSQFLPPELPAPSPAVHYEEALGAPPPKPPTTGTTGTTQSQTLTISPVISGQRATSTTTTTSTPPPPAPSPSSSSFIVVNTKQTSSAGRTTHDHGSFKSSASTSSASTDRSVHVDGLVSVAHLRR